MEGPLLEILIGITLIIISSVGGYVFNYFRLRKKEISKNTQNIDKIKDELKDVKRVLVMLAKRLDKGSAKYHNDNDTDYEELVKDLLTDEILHGGSRCAI